MSDEIQTTVQPVKFFIQLADEGPIPCQGIVKIPLNIDRQIYQQDILLADIAHLLFWADFLYQNNCQLDIRHRPSKF